MCQSGSRTCTLVKSSLFTLNCNYVVGSLCTSTTIMWFFFSIQLYPFFMFLLLANLYYNVHPCGVNVTILSLWNPISNSKTPTLEKINDGLTRLYRCTLRSKLSVKANVIQDPFEMGSIPSFDFISKRSIVWPLALVETSQHIDCTDPIFEDRTSQKAASGASNWHQVITLIIT